jgi:hypothetical protein
MRIDGTWMLDEGGVLYPLVIGDVLAADGTWVTCPFLIDTGSEATVISADVLHRLGLPTQPSRRQLRGIGGLVDSVSVNTQLRFTQPDGSPATVRHCFDALTEVRESDISVLGRDILGAFALIVDRPARVIHLGSGRHRYLIQES